MNEKLEKLKVRYPELTYSVYCKLKEKGLRNIDICEMYGFKLGILTKFVKSHYDVLGKMEVNLHEN